MTLTGHPGGAEITFWVLLDTVTQGLAASAGTGLGDKRHAALLCGHREPAAPPLGGTEQWPGAKRHKVQLQFNHAGDTTVTFRFADCSDRCSIPGTMFLLARIGFSLFSSSCSHTTKCTRQDFLRLSGVLGLAGCGLLRFQVRAE